MGGRCKESGLAKGSRPAGEEKEFKDPSKNRQQTGKRGFSSLDYMCMSSSKAIRKKSPRKRVRVRACRWEQLWLGASIATFCFLREVELLAHGLSRSSLSCLYST